MLSILPSRDSVIGYWPIDELTPNSLNPRGKVVEDAALAELATSIRAQGILQPLLITSTGVVIAGHRRLAAAKLAGLREVPVIVHDMSENRQLLSMIVENLQRADLSPLQEARAYQRLLDAGIHRAEIAREVGASPNRINERLAILRLAPEVQEMFGRSELPVTLARPLLKAIDPNRQRRLALLSAQRRLSVPQLEKLIDEQVVTAKPAVVVPKEERPMPRGTTRKKALELLKEHIAKRFTGRQFADAMDETCGICASCGMASIEAVCQECALPALVNRLVRMN